MLGFLSTSRMSTIDNQRLKESLKIFYATQVCCAVGDASLTRRRSDDDFAKKDCFAPAL
jgi:hypothetical protein